MPKYIDLTGKKFGKLTVIRIADRGKRGIRWLCKCDCGNKIVAYGADLRTKHQKSCGCLKWKGTPKHGMSDTRQNSIYRNMKKRCNNPNSPDYKNYGGRGIKYCKKWETFEGFWEDMKDGYSDELTLDRIDVDGDYCKENCRWAPKKIQANNTRMNHYVTYKGEKLTLSELADKHGADYELFRHRVMKGWSIEDALSDPREKEKISYNGVTKTIGEFAKDYGMTYHQLKKRLMRDWSIERALTQPLRKR